MTHTTLFIGLDTHKDSIAVALAEGGRSGEVRYFGQIGNEPAAVVKLVKQLADRYSKLHFCYEAGPCGYGLQRQLASLGHECVVVAPTHTPVKKAFALRTTGTMRWSWLDSTGQATSRQSGCRMKRMKRCVTWYAPVSLRWR